MRRIRLLAAVLVAASCVPACAPSAPATADSPTSLTWRECGTGVDCTTVTVPVDHTRPDGPTIDLAVARHAATDPAGRIGVLFYNPGGPGASAADPIRKIGAPDAPVPFGPDLLARYDVIGMDPRGVAGSGGVTCLTAAEREESLAQDLDPLLPGGLPRPDVVTNAEELAAGCEQAVDPDRLGRMATDDVARDTDLVREALGEEQISYLGTSYGTLLGATYATLFPQRVRHMALDAPVDPTTWQQDPLGSTTEGAAAAERVLDLYFATCRAEGAACPFGAGRPDAAFDELVQRLEASPLTVAASGAVPAGRVDGATVLIAGRVAVFSRQLWPVLTAGLLAAEGGDGSTIYALSAALVREPDGRPNGLLEANAAVNCLDRAVPADLAEHDRNAEQARGPAPRFGTISGYALVSCAVWPAQNPDRFTGPLTGAGAPPILVVGGREDSQTPYGWSESMARTLESGVLLTRDGVGHGSYGTSGPCIDGAVDRYLTTGETPAPGTVCPQEPPATTSLQALGG